MKKKKYKISLTQGILILSMEITAYDVLGAITQAIAKTEIELNVRLKQLDEVTAKEIQNELNN